MVPLTPTPLPRHALGLPQTSIQWEAARIRPLVRSTTTSGLPHALPPLQPSYVRYLGNTSCVLC